jgi:hypothetical protein
VSKKENEGVIAEISRFQTPAGMLASINPGGARDHSVVSVLFTSRNARQGRFLKFYASASHALSQHFYGRDVASHFRVQKIDATTSLLMFFFEGRAVPMFDSTNQPLPHGFSINEGSLIRLDVKLTKEARAILPRCRAIQVVDLHIPKSPFSEYEGGFVFSWQAKPAEPTPAS